MGLKTKEREVGVLKGVNGVSAWERVWENEKRRKFLKKGVSSMFFYF